MIKARVGIGLIRLALAAEPLNLTEVERTIFVQNMMQQTEHEDGDRRCEFD